MRKMLVIAKFCWRPLQEYPSVYHFVVWQSLHFNWQLRAVCVTSDELSTIVMIGCADDRPSENKTLVLKACANAKLSIITLVYQFTI